ncbi:MAG: methyltransferase [Deltaproteobacteria bacterium]|nr:methyltransferase [Deltaproteobacteria bacterium]
MDPQGIDRKLAAILSADVAGYGRLMAADEVSTLQTLTSYRGQMMQLVQQYRGRVVDSPGDNLLAEFPSALDASQCAVEMQRALQGLNADTLPERRMEFRIGLHLGDVMVTGDRIYGDGVNIAARLEGLAEPGGICISTGVYEQVRRKLPVVFEDLGQKYVKNLPEPIHVYRVRWDQASDSSQPTSPAPPRTDPLAGLSGRPDVAVFVVPAIWVLYVGVGLEILFMISPFALYYYSAYGPSLNLFHGSSATAWLTDFFLPHFSHTSSPWLDQTLHVGGILVVAGALVFLVGFVQVYGSKLLGKGAVTGGLYAFTRHPQYLGLAILGLGTLLIWPRFLVLVAYVTMLFLYGLLARWEEQRCLAQFGPSYRSYQDRVGSFSPVQYLSRLLPASGVRRFVAGLLLYVGVLGAVVAGGYGLRDYSLSKISSLFTQNMAVLSPAVLDEQELRAALTVATSDGRVSKQLRPASAREKLLVYVVPLDWQLADLPMEVPDPDGPRGHYQPRDFDRSLYKVLFTRVRTHHPEATGKDIVKQAYGRDPIVLVKVDTRRRRIIAIENTPPHVRWGDIPTPLF